MTLEQLTALSKLNDNELVETINSMSKEEQKDLLFSLPLENYLIVRELLVPPFWRQYLNYYITKVWADDYHKYHRN